jgi:hypothetical protein
MHKKSYGVQPGNDLTRMPVIWPHRIVDGAAIAANQEQENRRR